MKRVLRKQKPLYMLSLTFCIIGILALLTTLWKTSSQVFSSADPFSTFLSLLWIEEIVIINVVTFKLIYLVAFGDIMLILGVILWLLSRQWLVVPGKTVCYQCPFCKKKWKSTGDKALVHCPYCNQLVHPKIAEK
ncbi:hypothetical protein KEJ45_04600 [Candidatus Bathyarchaeota archaeon]|nr:hypothetical protein [Candidatus Bathyarchaeota archaeon]